MFSIVFPAFFCWATFYLQALFGKAMSATFRTNANSVSNLRLRDTGMEVKRRALGAPSGKFEVSNAKNAMVV